MGTAKIIPPNVTPEENQKRIRDLEQVLSNIFKCEITVGWKTPEEKATEQGIMIMDEHSISRQDGE